MDALPPPIQTGRAALRGEAPVYALPLLCAAMAFGPGLRGGFVLDDVPAIVQNPVVRGALPAAQAFLRTFWGRPLSEPPTAYRPLAALLFRGEAALFGLSAPAFHAVSLLLYLALVAALIFVGRALLDRRGACVAGCLFAVCPAHAENVASLVGGADTLSLLLALLSLACLRPALRGEALPRPLLRTAGAAALFLLALLAKEGAAPLPAIAAVLLCGAARGARARLRALLPPLALLLVLLAYLAARLRLVPLTFHNPIADDVLAGADLRERLLYAASLLSGYARLLVAPLDLCTGRKYAEVALPQGLDAQSLGGLAVLLLALARSAADLRRGRPALVLCALLCYSVYSSLLFSVPEAMADRFLLAPSAFLALPAGAALSRGLGRRPARDGLLCLLLVGFAALAARQAGAWRTTRGLLRDSVRSCPDSVHNHLRYADELSAAGEHAEAAWHYAVARDGRRRFPRAWSHPAPDAERMLPAVARLRHLPELLGAADPARARGELAAFLRFLGRPEEARLVLSPP